MSAKAWKNIYWLSPVLKIPLTLFPELAWRLAGALFKTAHKAGVIFIAAKGGNFFDGQVCVEQVVLGIHCFGGQQVIVTADAKMLGV